MRQPPVGDGYGRTSRQRRKLTWSDGTTGCSVGPTLAHGPPRKAEVKAPEPTTIGGGEPVAGACCSDGPEGGLLGF